MKQPPKAENTPEGDAGSIWDTAHADGKKRYHTGRQSHGTDLWTAGASWYCGQGREEILDGVAYMHHLGARIDSIREVANAMADGELSRATGATLILNLVNGAPTRSRKKRGGD